MLKRWYSILVILSSALAIPSESFGVDLTELSLEELMNVEVTTVSRQEQRMFETPAAIYVVTREDLRRSGVRSIPEALRSVPGLFVGRVDANKWAVSARGFVGLFSNKLLVLIDGRSVYSPLFSGVFWEAQDVVLEDVERIEVIRGSGGALWGANAVNGIINIITREAAETRGSLIKMGAGTEEQGFVTARYGARLGSRGNFRVYSKYFKRDRSTTVRRDPIEDGWEAYRFGGRYDWIRGEGEKLHLQGNLYTGDVGQTLSIVTDPSPPFERIDFSIASIGGGDLLGRWEKSFSDHSNIATQLSYDRSARSERISQGAIQNFDLDFQHQYQVPGHDFLWGFGYRLTSDEFQNTYTVGFDPATRNVNLFSGFIEDRLFNVSENFRITLGSKFEHNSYSGFEYQPNVRLWGAVAPGQALWAAIARAVRTPSRVDRDILAIRLAFPPDSLFSGSPVGLARLQGDRGFKSESVRSIDVGYRGVFGDRLFLDLALFLNFYSDLRTNEPDFQAFEIIPSPLHIVVPVTVANKAKGRTHGIELSMDYVLRARARIRASYSYFRMDIDPDEDSFDSEVYEFENESPRHQARIATRVDLSPHLEMDVGMRFVDRLLSVDIDRYLTCDVRLGWRPNNRIEISVVGQNLLDRSHQEFISEPAGTLPSEVQRGFYGAIKIGF